MGLQDFVVMCEIKEYVYDTTGTERGSDYMLYVPFTLIINIIIIVIIHCMDNKIDCYYLKNTYVMRQLFT